MSIIQRKMDHINLALKKDVSFRSISAGFEDVFVFHNSLPELNFEEVNAGCVFLKKRLSAPILIDAITGGFSGAEKINKKLASAAEKEGIAFAMGSQRAMIQNPDLSYTYKVRDVAPTVPIIGNVGIANLDRLTISKLDSAMKEVDADAFAIHLNPLQEAIQKEGDKDFSQKTRLINEVCDSVDIPVIIKEVGHGISPDALKEINKTKAKMINVAGAGGTSWTKIESLRSGSSSSFNEDGIPTVVSLVNAKRITKKELIVSGGVRSGIDIAKGIVLGAELGGAAVPFLHAYKTDKIETLIRNWRYELKVFMFSRGVKGLKGLRKLKPIVIGKTAELLSPSV